MRLGVLEGRLPGWEVRRATQVTSEASSPGSKATWVEVAEDYSRVD